VFGPLLRQTSLLIRFAIVALVALAMAKLLPRAAGATLTPAEVNAIAHPPP
jgi:hypothetical protein